MITLKAFCPNFFFFFFVQVLKTFQRNVVQQHFKKKKHKLFTYLANPYTSVWKMYCSVVEECWEPAEAERLQGMDCVAHVRFLEAKVLQLAFM